MWARLCNFTKKQASSQIFAKTLLKLSKLLFCRLSRWWLLLVLDKNSRRQFLILINASASRDIDFHETSKTTALIEQALVVHGTPCFFMIGLIHSRKTDLEETPSAIFLIKTPRYDYCFVFPENIFITYKWVPLSTFPWTWHWIREYVWILMNFYD